MMTFKFKVYKVAVFRTVQHVIKFTLCVHLNGSRWTLVGFCALYQILLHLPSPSIERWRAAKLHEGMRTDAWQITHCSQSPWTLQDFSGKVKNTAFKAAWNMELYPYPSPSFVLLCQPCPCRSVLFHCLLLEIWTGGLWQGLCSLHGPVELDDVCGGLYQPLANCTASTLEEETSGWLLGCTV